MVHRYTLEKYKGASSRHRCPNCGKTRQFVRYIDLDTGSYLSDGVGRCNRESKCGYHVTPKEHFADNPQNDSRRILKRKPRKQLLVPPKSVDYIQNEVLKSTLTNYERNNLVKFLLSRFDAKEVTGVIRRYLIGTWHDGRTIFWQIDRKNHIRTGKLISYDAEKGKRSKTVKPNWMHVELKRRGNLSNNFNLRQCLFGEHLLSAETLKPVAIVESEKTAIIASICLPDFVWLAVGGKSNLKATTLARLGTNRRIILFPDSDAFEKWNEILISCKRLGLNIEISTLIEKRGLDIEKANGFDIADYLIKSGEGKPEAIKLAFEGIQNYSELTNEFEYLLDERLAIVEFDGNLSSKAARDLCASPGALRSLALQVAQSR
ncbi:MAG: hypothetical protein IPN69_06970 [Acidobacteria bacterium]|nr:hypothetical protein [Acidobacteriota bacterium]